MKFKSTALSLLLAGLSATPLLAMPRIIVEGWDGTGWRDINDGDLNPNQAVTDFDTVDWNYRRTRDYRIRNNGNQTVVIERAGGWTSSNNRFTFDPADVPSGNITLLENQTRGFSIRYSPSSRNLQETTITFQTNLTNGFSTYNFALEGQGQDGEASINYDPSSGSDVGISDGASASSARGTDFGQLNVGGGNVSNQTRTRDFYLRNSSSANARLRWTGAQITGAGASHFELLGLPEDGTLGKGNNENFRIRFDPSSPGVKNATLTLRCSDQNEDPYNISLRGEGVATSEVRVQGRRIVTGATFTEILDNDTLPRSEDGTLFNDTNVGSTFTSRFRVHNDGDRNLTIDNLDIIGSGRAAFQFIGANTSDILPGSSRDFDVRFTPTSGVTYFAAITFNNNDPDGGENPFNFSIRGIGRAPIMTVSGKGVDNTFRVINDGGSNSPRENNGTDFGPQNTNAGAAEREYLITNTGNTRLTISGRDFPSDTENEWAVRSLLNGPVLNIDPGESDTFFIRFDPKNVGVETTRFDMDTNDPAVGTYTFDLRGEGVGLPEITMQGRRRVTGATLTAISDGDATPRSEDGTRFNNTEVGSTFRSVFRITNEGEGILNITEPKITGPGSGAFSFDSFNGASIDPGDRFEFDVIFTPTAGISYDAEISLTTNDSSESPFNFSIRGTGLASEIAVLGRGNASQFGLISDGDSSPRVPDGTIISAGIGASPRREFRIDNTGNKVLKITDAYFLNDDENEFDFKGLMNLAGNRNIEPGENHRFEVEFKPRTVGTKSVTLVLENDDPNEDPYNFAMQGIASGEPEIQVRGLTSTGIAFDIDDGDLNPDQDVTRFGKTDLNDTTVRNFRIKNDGTDALIFSRVSSSNPQFLISSVPSVISAGDQADFQISFTPTEIGDDIRATIELHDNVGNINAPYRFAVTGIGEGPLMVLLGGADQNMPIQDGDSSPSTDDLTLFSALPVNGASTTVQFAIRNDGNKNLQIQRASSITGDQAGEDSFSIERGDFFSLAGPRVISPGATVLLPITFNPSEEGIIDANVVLETNQNGSGEIYQFAVRGIGLDPDAVPNIEVFGGASLNQLITSGDSSPATSDGTDFGTIQEDDDAVTQTFQITNTSEQSVLNISGISILSPGGSFSTSQAGDNDLDPGQSTSFKITLDPAAASGVRSAILSISTNDPDTATYAFTLTANVEAVEPSDPPAVSGTLIDGDDLVFVLDAPAGATFKVISSPTMNGDWTDVPGQTGLSSGTIRLEDVLNQAGSLPRQFFRVVRE